MGEGGAGRLRIGVLALQGDVAAHATALAEVGALPVPVRRPADLGDLAGLVIPGGESTTLSLLLSSSGIVEPLDALIAAGLPVLGTCAGLILLAREVVDGRPDQRSFGAMDIVVRRNAFGRQVSSFESDVVVAGCPGPPVRAVFIRAPAIEEAGPAVEVLAEIDTPMGCRAVACRQGAITVTAFHPELTTDRRIHEMFVSGIKTSHPHKIAKR